MAAYILLLDFVSRHSTSNLHHPLFDVQLIKLIASYVENLPCEYQLDEAITFKFGKLIGTLTNSKYHFLLFESQLMAVNKDRVIWMVGTKFLIFRTFILHYGKLVVTTPFNVACYDAETGDILSEVDSSRDRNDWEISLFYHITEPLVFMTDIIGNTRVMNLETDTIQIPKQIPYEHVINGSSKTAAAAYRAVITHLVFPRITIPLPWRPRHGDPIKDIIYHMGHIYICFEWDIVCFDYKGNHCCRYPLGFDCTPQRMNVDRQGLRLFICGSFDANPLHIRAIWFNQDNEGDEEEYLTPVPNCVQMLAATTEYKNERYYFLSESCGSIIIEMESQSNEINEIYDIEVIVFDPPTRPSIMRTINNQLFVQDIYGKWYRRVSKYKLKPCDAPTVNWIQFDKSAVISWGCY